MSDGTTLTGIMPYKIILELDYRAKIGIQRRLRQSLGVKIDDKTLEYFISFCTSLTFWNLEWHGRTRNIELIDLWKSFLGDLRKKGRYDTVLAPDIRDALKKVNM